jgi:tRNA U34 2-thiouridine synthase MnmA/TrmU
MLEKAKAIALISGGLDSMLAAKIVKEQGVHVEGINFYTGFCVEGHTQAIRKKARRRGKRNNALWVAERLGIKLHIVDVVEEYKGVVINPRYGYGSNLNPCLDCKVFMVTKAREWMEKNGFEFIITGEVVGQRPMSQRRYTMPLIAKQSEANDLLLRPLCAKNLPITKPERESWVDREQLFGIGGRSRSQQIKLAQRFGIKDYAQPAGGCCFLTDPNYTIKLNDLWANRGNKYYELDDIILLKIGRHLRPRPHFKLIISREEGESRYLQGYRKQYMHITTNSHGGPLTLLDGENISAEDQLLAARITARFSQGRDAKLVTVSITPLGGETQVLGVVPLPPEDIPRNWYL